jgi:hypothetical protein
VITTHHVHVLQVSALLTPQQAHSEQTCHVALALLCSMLTQHSGRT